MSGNTRRLNLAGVSSPRFARALVVLAAAQFGCPRISRAACRRPIRLDRVARTQLPDLGRAQKGGRGLVCVKAESGLIRSAVGAYSDNEKPPVDYHHCFRADHCSVDGLPFPLARRFVITRPATDRQVDWASTILQPS